MFENIGLHVEMIMFLIHWVKLNIIIFIVFFLSILLKFISMLIFLLCIWGKIFNYFRGSSDISMDSAALESVNNSDSGTEAWLGF